ncbi:MAG TPA: metallophosphoesterase family protein [Candidatus Nanoarchaeia archaeon]|nr:metallophosphoesterase family protein [Candidatus Nanoarchaeia archaeon]
MTRRLLVISDVHSNMEALEAVLSDAQDLGPFDMKLCAGDLVGYGPNPNEVVQRVFEEGFIGVLGNHDRAVRGGDYAGFNVQAALAVQYNQRVLSEQNLLRLKSLSNVPYLDPECVFAMVHGSFDGASEPSKDKKRYEDEYILGLEDFPGPLLRALDVKLGIIGHTHQPTLAYRLTFLMPIPVEGDTSSVGRSIHTLDMETSPRAIVNLGSVGQPRDGDPRAAYGIVTLEQGQISLHFRRVPYDFATTQKRIREADLPESLATRLSRGR